jgi:hypothetical protein
VPTSSAKEMCFTVEFVRDPVDREE